MYVLGIETSCDETSVAVVKNGRQILANEISSSLKFHSKYGGVIPEIASRMQLETIAQVADSALKDAGVSLADIGLVGVTNGPGLLGSLLVGISFAKSVSLSLNIPLLGVNHVFSHIYANFLNEENVTMPFVALVVSGGHTSLFLVRDFDRIDILGQTQDDACGEAFDKVARIMGLGYPGGPIIERLAKKGNPKAIPFRCCGTHAPLNFSFSGIKTAVLYYLRKQGYALKENGTLKKCPKRIAADVAASFQNTVIDALIQKAFLACRTHHNNRLVVGGGVVMNNMLREKFQQHADSQGIACYFPPKTLCMDNAAMVAGLGYQLYKKGHQSDLFLNTGWQ